MSSSPSAEEIARDARWLVQAIDPKAGLARLVEMGREDYRSEAFLDDRMLERKRTAVLAPWPTVAEAAEITGRTDARWIFHIGHVGSTLVSRLLGELDGVLAVREPRSLRDAAMVSPDVRAPIVSALPALMSRSFAAEQLACVKATSFVSEIASELVPVRERALFLTASPRNYVASILAGENSVRELHALAGSRLQRMAGRVEAFEGGHASDAHRAAAAWACEATSLEAAAEQMANRSLAWVDFDAFLADLEAQLSAIVEHFGFAASEADLTAIISGPVVRRYSKAMEHDYSPALRRELIEEAGSANRADIDSALAMLDRAAPRSPLLERALARAREIECSAS